MDGAKILTELEKLIDMKLDKLRKEAAGTWTSQDWLLHEPEMLRTKRELIRLFAAE